jgi:hypothetical protein
LIRPLIQPLKQILQPPLPLQELILQTQILPLQHPPKPPKQLLSPLIRQNFKV